MKNKKELLSIYEEMLSVIEDYIDFTPMPFEESRPDIDYLQSSRIERYKEVLQKAKSDVND